ncbi:DNA polymerase beta domain protein region [Stanieria cyanosphaera PCC 7437]|uniref:DNA polymerase beta domain protein region n=1 Tax=Stanieria cyanosphaera (strain ATCC 29371 / PCC 7437) TaxID=111780 RepID=K9Y0P7_STAC7|nr:nucleotidyltransferase domain-containing protein [Stanieria cyanosphaera]AFZ37512.1 DNA polymerase beta domain protein region [Stanieria cyanosphaera PCC 7437]
MSVELDAQIQTRLGISTEKIAQFCQRWHITELLLFGSVLSDQFHAQSDIDILIRFAPNARQGLLTLAKIKHELEETTGRRVDLALKESIENSENWIRRHEILKTAQVIYEQR